MTTDFKEQLPDLLSPAEESSSSGPQNATLSGAVLRIPVTVQVVIGSARVSLSQITKLAPGTTLNLDERLGAPARMLVNGREVARGDLFVVDEANGRLGMTITEVAGTSTEP